MKTLLTIAMLLIISGSTLAVPVDPNASSGIAAWESEGDHLYVLTTGGELLYLHAPIAATWESHGLYLPDGIQVADIADWSRQWLMTHDGTIWRTGSIYTPNWNVVPSLPEGTVTSSVEGLGDLKSMFR